MAKTEKGNGRNNIMNRVGKCFYVIEITYTNRIKGSSYFQLHAPSERKIKILCYSNPGKKKTLLNHNCV